jgi:16S rRNA (guanine1207-N2)-methyltransferase
VVDVSEHYFSVSPSSTEHRGLIKCNLRGLKFEFLTSSGVFSHRRIDNGTRLLVEEMELPDTGRVLDIGCGYGALGIVAARLNLKLEVWMTDINPRAVRLAEENATRNGVHNVIVKQGSLYSPVGDTMFAIVVTNPPISAGIEKVVEPMITHSYRHLDPGGAFQLVVQSNKGGRILAEIIEETFGEAQVLARGSGYRVLKGEKKLY